MHKSTVNSPVLLTMFADFGNRFSHSATSVLAEMIAAKDLGAEDTEYIASVWTEHQEGREKIVFATLDGHNRTIAKQYKTSHPQGTEHKFNLAQLNEYIRFCRSRRQLVNVRHAQQRAKRMIREYHGFVFNPNNVNTVLTMPAS